MYYWSLTNNIVHLYKKWVILKVLFPWFKLSSVAYSSNLSHLTEIFIQNALEITNVTLKKIFVEKCEKVGFFLSNVRKTMGIPQNYHGNLHSRGQCIILIAQ